MILLTDRHNVTEWHVYALVDPSSDTIFYVGMTARPHKRLQGHFSNPASAAYIRCREIRKGGLRPELKVLATFSEYQHAAQAETLLLREYCGRLTNRHPYRARVIAEWQKYSPS